MLENIIGKSFSDGIFKQCLWGLENRVEVGETKYYYVRVVRRGVVAPSFGKYGWDWGTGEGADPVSLVPF